MLYFNTIHQSKVYGAFLYCSDLCCSGNIQLTNISCKHRAPQFSSESCKLNHTSKDYCLKIHKGGHQNFEQNPPRADQKSLLSIERIFTLK